MSNEQSEPEVKTSAAQQLESLATSADQGIGRRFWRFVVDRKAFWLAPIIFWLLVLGFIMLLGGTAAAPFIYTLF